MDQPWLKNYPKGVPATIQYDQYASIVQLLEESYQKYATRPAFTCMGKTLTYGDVDAFSRSLAAYLQSLGLQQGDRVALMMPNVLQYTVAVAAVLRAGFVAVNVNPLYTPRELEHQLKDSGAKAIIILENFAATLQQVLDKTPVKHIVLAAMGDMMGMCIKNADKIGLSEEQKKKITPLHQEMQKKQIRFQADLKIAHLEMKEIMEPKDFDLEKATAAAKKTEEMKTAYHVEMLKSMKEVRSVFTEEQYKKLRAMMHMNMEAGKPAKGMKHKH